MNTTSHTTAIVVGASMTGLMTARVLSDHFDTVRILERDRLDDATSGRRGVPQGRHAHALLAVGQQHLEEWFPNIVNELVDRGGVPLNRGEMIWYQAGSYQVNPDLGYNSTSISRPLLEAVVRKRLLTQRPNVTIVDDITVDRPLMEDGRVVGVLADGTEHRATLVVDCGGRNTRTLDQLAEVGFPIPDVSSVKIDMAYGTRMVRRRPDDLDATAAVVIGEPGPGRRLGFLVPVEDDQWMITIGAFHGERPPTDPNDFESFCRELPTPHISDVLARSEALTPVMTHRMHASQRRHMERLDRTPQGFVLLGDAICSFNPIYGQGMSSAALQASALGRVLDRYGVTSPRLARDFYRAVAKVVDPPWKIAAGGDFADPRTSGSKPVGTDLLNRYLRRVFLACHTSLTVTRQLTLVQNLTARPESLLTPAMILRVLRAARRSPAAGTGAASATPVDRVRDKEAV